MSPGGLNSQGFVSGRVTLVQGEEMTAIVSSRFEAGNGCSPLSSSASRRDGAGTRCILTAGQLLRMQRPAARAPQHTAALYWYCRWACEQGGGFVVGGELLAIGERREGRVPPLVTPPQNTGAHTGKSWEGGHRRGEGSEEEEGGKSLGERRGGRGEANG